MSVLLVLIGVSLLVAAGFLGAFLWAVRSGQFDDRYTPSIRMLFEERPPPREAVTDHQSVDHHHA
jgi:cbb3-type cytochrome oxidase maturation protein